jgi:rSAM/selenodomain-associated transferase 1
MTAARSQIAVLARAPVAGRAKTRLIPLLGAAGAAQLQARLIELTLAKALTVPECAVHLWLDGDPAALPPAAQQVAVHRQEGADLGARMAHAFAQTLRLARPTILIGTDCPALTAGHLRHALACLADHDVVVQPATDGGYVLIGLNAPQPRLFADIPWGGPQVMAVTQQRIDALGLRCARPEPLPDLDLPEDYRHAVAQGWI